MNVPNVVGFYLGEVRKVLFEMGVNIVSIKVTAPPRNISYEFDDSYRVVRQVLVKPNEIALLVCKPL